MRKHFWVVAGLFLMVLLFTTHGLKAQDNDMDGELQKDILEFLCAMTKTNFGFPVCFSRTNLARSTGLWD